MYSLLTINQFQIGDFIVQLLFIFILLTLIVSLTCLFKHDGCNLGVFFRTSGGYVDGGGILLFRIFYFRSLNGASVSLLHFAEFYGC